MPSVYISPNTVVIVPGAVVNSTTYISPTKLEFEVTTDATEQFLDIEVSNCQNTDTLVGALEVKNLTVLIPGDGTTLWVRIGQTPANVATSLGKLVPTITGSAWNKGASFGTVPAATDFELEFNPVYMAGQSTGGYAISRQPLERGAQPRLEIRCQLT